MRWSATAGTRSPDSTRPGHRASGQGDDPEPVGAGRGRRCSRVRVTLNLNGIGRYLRRSNDVMSKVIRTPHEVDRTEGRSDAVHLWNPVGFEPRDYLPEHLHRY